MLKIILISFLLNFHTSSDYERGFEYGYIKGFCYNKANCVTPNVPNCPVLGYNEQDTYNGGYNRGFAMGLKDQ